MKFRILIIVAVFYLGLSSCSKDSGLTIKGNIENAENIKAYFDAKSFNNSIMTLENVDLKNGQFKFNFPEALDPGIYRVRLGAKSIDLVLTGTESTVNITGNLSTLQNFDYKVEGSELSSSYQNSIKSLIDKKTTLPALYQNTIKSDDPLLSMALVLGTAPANPQMYQTYQQVSNKLNQSYKDTKIGLEFANLTAKMKKNFDMSQSRYKVKVGQPAPDIVMEDTNGKIRKLSDLKGQVVLLDFWASWCGPCRRSNPQVVKTYKKFKDKGFTVFNVSLDGMDARTKSRFPADQLDTQMKRQKQRWLDAIKKDNLIWDNHVSDLKKWDSAGAALYGVRSIPTTFLIDKDGNIAALNPSKATLESAITTLL